MAAKENSNGRNRAWSLLFWGLTLLFSTRVLGQAVQRWAPQSFLPPSASFQGSGLPYGVLLSVQAAILLLMANVAWRAGAGTLSRNARTGRVFAWVGGVYLGLALARIAIGLAVPDAPAWFHTWIPAAFHLVLAAFVLTLALYHRAERKPA